jgi:hypothetical protein
MSEVHKNVLSPRARRLGPTRPSVTEARYDLDPKADF